MMTLIKVRRTVSITIVTTAVVVITLSLTITGNNVRLISHPLKSINTFVIATEITMMKTR